VNGRGGARGVGAVVLVALVVVAGLLLGRWSSGGDDSTTGVAVVSDVDGDGTFEHDYRIPAGTADRIDAGEEVEIVPAELVVQVGEAIRIVNDDTEGHVVGVFYVGAGETLTQRFERTGVLEGECSVHPSGSFTLRVVDA
jgi:plastocyanin